jgi:hypothetical protein
MSGVLILENVNLVTPGNGFGLDYDEEGRGESFHRKKKVERAVF